MSKFKVGDEVFFIEPVWGGVLRGEIKEVGKQRGKDLYLVHARTNLVDLLYHKTEAKLFDARKAATIRYCRSEIKKHEIAIRKLKKELKECLSK